MASASTFRLVAGAGDYGFWAMPVVELAERSDAPNTVVPQTLANGCKRQPLARLSQL